MEAAKLLLAEAEELETRGIKGAQKIVKKVRAEMRFLEGKSDEGDEPSTL